MKRIIFFWGAYLLSTHMAIAQDTIWETKNICQLDFHNFEIEDNKKEEIERGVRMMVKIYKNVHSTRQNLTWVTKCGINQNLNTFSELLVLLVYIEQDILQMV